MCVCVQSIIKVPAAPDDSKQVVSWLHDARQYSQRRALNAMHYVYVMQYVRSTREISLCYYTLQYMISAY